MATVKAKKQIDNSWAAAFERVLSQQIKASKQAKKQETPPPAYIPSQQAVAVVTPLFEKMKESRQKENEQSVLPVHTNGKQSVLVPRSAPIPWKAPPSLPPKKPYQGGGDSSENGNHCKKENEAFRDGLHSLLDGKKEPPRDEAPVSAEERLLERVERKRTRKSEGYKFKSVPTNVLQIIGKYGFGPYDPEL